MLRDRLAARLPGATVQPIVEGASKHQVTLSDRCGLTARQVQHHLEEIGVRVIAVFHLERAGEFRVLVDEGTR